jgi:hypothetical protein
METSEVLYAVNIPAILGTLLLIALILIVLGFKEKKQSNKKNSSTQDWDCIHWTDGFAYRFSLACQFGYDTCSSSCLHARHSFVDYILGRRRNSNRCGPSNERDIIHN